MKNIWKLFMIAMIAIAMVGCPQPQGNTGTSTPDNPPAGDTSSSGSSGDVSGSGSSGDVSSSGSSGETGIVFPTIPGSFVSQGYDYSTFAEFGAGDTKGTGVYEFSGKIEDIGDQWGGSPASPMFSIMLLNDVGIEALASGSISDAKDMAAGSPLYQVQGVGNATFLTSKSGTYQNAYAGLTATVDVEAGTYTVYVDMSKLLKGQLKGIGKDFQDNGGEKELGADDTVNLTGFKPYILAIEGKKDTHHDDELCYFWNASMLAMDPATEYPEVTELKTVMCHVHFQGKLFIAEDGDMGIQDVDWGLLNVVYYDGEKIPFTFYNGSYNVETNEVAEHGKTLTVTLNQTVNESDLADHPDWFNWEYSQGEETDLINDYYKKLSIAGNADKWIGFDSLTGDKFDCVEAGYFEPIGGDTTTFRRVISIAGPFNGWTHEDLKKGSYELTADAAEIEFAFGNGTWDYKITGFTVAADDPNGTELTEANVNQGDNGKITGLTLYAGYKISLTKADGNMTATVKVVKTADAPAFATTTITFKDGTTDAANTLGTDANATAWGSYKFTAPAATKDGYDFIGWSDSTSDDSTTDTVWMKPGQTAVTLYAVWKAAVVVPPTPVAQIATYSKEATTDTAFKALADFDAATPVYNAAKADFKAANSSKTGLVKIDTNFATKLLLVDSYGNAAWGAASFANKTPAEWWTNQVTRCGGSEEAALAYYNKNAIAFCWDNSDDVAIKVFKGETVKATLIASTGATEDKKGFRFFTMNFPLEILGGDDASQARFDDNSSDLNGTYTIKVGDTVATTFKWTTAAGFAEAE